jgi:phosphate:Na+ symporter
MNESVKVVFGLLGGLALFLYGMTMMSESLQKAAGERMKAVLAMLTRNPILGVISGALVTAVLQSSSATTVMVISFISAGLMTLPQGISVIFGANIGTTMTAQIIAFKLSDYIYIIIFAGFLLSFFAKQQKIKYIGDTILSFGLLFLGIDIMGSVMKPLASSPFFTDLIARVSRYPVLGVAVGTMMTLVVQSSSATIAVLQNFASQAAPDGVSSILGLTGAIPILLGDNIGTTITAILASLRQSRDAKRAAAAHCIFNVSGTLLFIWFIKPYAAFIQMISTKGPEVDVISRQIANAHTGFNITMVLIWTPLLGLMVKIVMQILPDKRPAAAGIGSAAVSTVPAAIPAGEPVSPDVITASAASELMTSPLFTDEKLISQPVAALHLIAGEIGKCTWLLSQTFTAFTSMNAKNIWQTLIDIRKLTGLEQQLNKKIADCLASMFSEGVMNEEQAAKASGVLFALGDLDRVAAMSSEIMENIASNRNAKHVYSKDALKDLRKAVSVLSEMYEKVRPALLSGDLSGLQDLQETRESIRQLSEKMRVEHMKRVRKGKCAGSLTESWNELLQNIDRIGNSCLNLADAAQEGALAGL